MRTRIAALAVPALLAATVATAAPAQALENPVDVVRIALPAKVVISSNACRNLAVTYTVSTDPGWELGYASVDITRNGVVKDPEVVTAAGLQPYLFCPVTDGLGIYRFGGSFVNGGNPGTGDAATWRDATAASVKIGVATKASIAGTRSGTKVAFTVKTQRYVLSAEAFRPWSASKVVIQKKRADGTWATFATIAYTSTGTAKATLTAGRGTYRAVAPGTSWIWQPTSPAVAL